MKNVRYQRLMSMIPVGEQAAVHMKDLAIQFGTSERELRKHILEARKAGLLIVSSVRGYFQPETQNELKRYCDSRRSAALSTFSSTKTARSTLKAQEETGSGQISFDVDEAGDEQTKKE